MRLQWADLDNQAGVLVIKRGLVQVKGVVITKDTKSHQRRRVALDPATIALFARRWERSIEVAAVCRSELGPWVFSADAAHQTPRRPEAWSAQFRHLTKRANVSARLHDLRHFAATPALDAGVPLPTVSKRLGHRDVSTTANFYAHAISQSDRHAAAVLGALMVAPEP